MSKLADRLRKLLGKQGRRSSGGNIMELRTAFRKRYHHFKLLLNANNKALEIMSNMEGALRGSQPFGMSFVKASCTAVSVNVLQIIRNLNDLAPGKYAGLHDSFKNIQESITGILASTRIPESGPLIVPLEEADKDLADLVGAKMANLGEVANRLHMWVPAGFVISSRGYLRFMEFNDLQTEIDRRIQASDVEKVDEMFALSAGIQQLIIQASIPEDLEEAIRRAYENLESRVGKGLKVSLRSSALAEDMAGSSFAGQYRSELNVSRDHITQVYKEIVASKYSLPAMTYRFNRGIRDEDVLMCVGCMAMVRSRAGGVTYSRNPTDMRDESVVINAVRGLPKTVVDGSVRPDLFMILRSAPLVIQAKEIHAQKHKLACLPEEGVDRVELTDEEGSGPSISDEEALRLAEVALRLEEHYGCAQDIEWALDSEGSIYLLQCRPLQRVEAAARQTEGPLRGAAAGTVLLQGGMTASPGVACGPAFLARRNVDLLRFPRGAVLVTAQASPIWASLLGQAVAVVTEQGSITGHLASVAREFGVPALLGVPGALERLKEGVLITVDADAGIVHEGETDLPAREPRIRKNLMEGSPVHEILKQVSEHTVFLHLLDPFAPDFRPAKCRTLHDITRFAHEQAVKEMFHFGVEHGFSERSSKQLVCGVPMQLWVINLDDGFTEEVQGKYVSLDNIVSTPMLALWEGMRAIPWEGPPPIDAKGFLSVMFQATTNPNLDPAMMGTYGERNYFMVSKNFCSLQSRFGFHFSTVEALVSDRPMENYISFHFKGGAADYQRRLSRVVFIGDLLGECGFRTEVRADSLAARLEGYDEEHMKGRLRVLGYMIIHTRQLDMVMSSEASALHHRAKMKQEIDLLLARSPASFQNSSSSA